MSEIKQITTPLTKKIVHSLKAGDVVSISGTIYTARDIAHKKLCETLQLGEKLPFDIEGAIIYFTGPTPARPNKIIGSIGPTTSSRMDSFSPKLIASGLKGMVGKGYRSGQVRESLKEYSAVHFSAIGGAGALISKSIISSEVIAYPELGTEAVRKLEVNNFEAIVAYDCFGNSVYKEERLN